MGTVTVFKAFAAIAITALLAFAPPNAFAQVAETQRLLNSLGLDAGPADGAAGERTMAAWRTFLGFRGLPLDTPLDAAGLAEIRGQVDIKYPTTSGTTFDQVGYRFSSQDTYRLDPDDPSAFSITLKGGDYDPVDFRGSGDLIERSVNFNFRKQRAELVSQFFPSDQTYTIDFDVMMDNQNTGSFFQVHRDGPSGLLLSAFKNGVMLYAGENLQNLVIYQTENWYGKWHPMRVVFRPAVDGKTWFRIYIDGQLAIDTSQRDARLPFSGSGATVSFGLYRGDFATATTASYRNIRLTESELGAPDPL